MQPDKAPTSNVSQPREAGRPNDYDDSRKYGAVETRPGMMGRPVLAVLLAGLVLALVAWAAVEYWGPDAYRDNNAGTATTTPETPAPATSQAPSAPQSGNPDATVPSTIEPPANPATGGTPETQPAQPNNSNGASGSAPAPQAP